MIRLVHQQVNHAQLGICDLNKLRPFKLLQGRGEMERMKEGRRGTVQRERERESEREGEEYLR